VLISLGTTDAGSPELTGDRIEIEVR